MELFTYHRIQAFGNTEIQYLESQSRKHRKEAFFAMTEYDIPCIVLMNNHTLEPELLNRATEREIPVFSMPLQTVQGLDCLTRFLDIQFAPQITLHGSLLDVYGVGVLLVGRSGIGKSEIALDLVERGHRLVADDVVVLTKKGDDVLLGSGTPVMQHFMEIRGLGIIDVRHMFGVRSIRYQKRLEVVVELEEWSDTAEYTRTGLDVEEQSLLDVRTQFMRLPIIAGKNIAVIAEAIALRYLSRMYGHDAAQELQKRLFQEMKHKEKLHKTTTLSEQQQLQAKDHLTFYYDTE
jgi:HPr kinase/phosphorylase